jgi:hypothetical protein
VGSNPTRSIYFILANYGIRLSSFWVVVRQNSPATTFFPYAVGTIARRKANFTFRRQAPTVGASYVHAKNNHTREIKKASARRIYNIRIVPTTAGY